MIKVGAKKKRTRKQLNEVKEVEKQLKQDKHAFLLEVKNLKQQADDAMKFA